MTCTTVAQLLQPSLAFCFSLQPMTAYRKSWRVRRHWLQAKTKRYNEDCNSCASLAGLVLLHVLFYF